ncbi:MAG: YbaB/EbfC family nucleoid-associated protein [Hyphomicrobiales bacterium]
MRDFGKMLKQAQELQGRMAKLNEEVESLEIEGKAGGGLVTVVLNGKNELKTVRIDPSLMKPEEVEILEDLIVAAQADARQKAETVLADRMRDLTGGLQLPAGMKLPF